MSGNSCLSDCSMYLGYKHEAIRACITHTLLSHGKWCLASKISFMESEEEGTSEVGERPRKKTLPLILWCHQKWSVMKEASFLTPAASIHWKQRLTIIQDGSLEGDGFLWASNQNSKQMTMGVLAVHHCQAVPQLYFFKVNHTEYQLKTSPRDCILLILHRLNKRSANPLEIVTEAW